MKLQLVFLLKSNKAVGYKGWAFLIDYRWPIAAFKTEFRIDRGEQNGDFYRFATIRSNSPVFTLVHVLEASSS